MNKNVDMVYLSICVRALSCSWEWLIWSTSCSPSSSMQILIGSLGEYIYIYIYTTSGWGDESVVLVVLYSFFQSCHSRCFFFGNVHHRPGLRSNVTVPEISLSSDRRINRDTPISEPSLLQHRSCPPLAPSHCGDLRCDLCQRDEQARTLLRILKRGCFFHLLTTFQVSYQSFVSRTSWTTGLSRDGLPESLDGFL